MFQFDIFLVVVVSYNQPKFCSNAAWNQQATTFADRSSTFDSDPEFIFVNINNTVYVVDSGRQCVFVWLEGSSTPLKPKFDTLSSPRAVFVTITDEIYVGNTNYQQIEKSTLTAAGSTVVVTNVIGECCGLFIDINDNIYCSIRNMHKVIKKSLKDPIANPSTTVAGTGSSGSSSNMLDNPFGIFVDINLDLYVADRDNNRIQLFKSGQMSGITLVGNGGDQTITLITPTGIVLDADKYLFIVDRGNHRIIGQGPNGFRCLVGCSNSYGSAPDQLNGPTTLSFDSYGNIFVVDNLNGRIQKFDFLPNSCSKSLKIFFKNGK